MPLVMPKHACCHDGTPYVPSGNADARKRKLSGIEAFPCPSCRRKAADKEADELRIPRLKGTDKQIAWASDIRKKIAAMRNFQKIVEEHAYAAWWIENKDRFEEAEA